MYKVTCYGPDKVASRVKLHHGKIGKPFLVINECIIGSIQEVDIFIAEFKAARDDFYMWDSVESNKEADNDLSV